MKTKPRKPSRKSEKHLGHGSHWGALGLGDVGNALPFLHEAVRNAPKVDSFSPPWPRSPFPSLTQLEWPQAPLSFSTIVGRDDAAKTNVVLSAFPTLTKTAEWIVRVDGILDSYGAVEGVVEGNAASGHPLQWFAPRFGFEVEHWRKPGLARVAFAALALRIERFDAKPIVVREGPLIQMRRNELRAEGNAEEADSDDFSVEVQTDGMRTFFSSFHDHHEFIGEVRAVRTIRPRPEFAGWLLDVEFLPDDPESGHRMPLYVFPSALEPGYVPKRGDLVQGLAWLQGSWVRAASSDDVRDWKKAGGEPDEK